MTRPPCRPDQNLRHIPPSRPAVLDHNGPPGRRDISRLGCVDTPSANLHMLTVEDCGDCCGTRSWFRPSNNGIPSARNSISATAARVYHAEPVQFPRAFAARRSRSASLAPASGLQCNSATHCCGWPLNRPVTKTPSPIATIDDLNSIGTIADCSSLIVSPIVVSSEPHDLLTRDVGDAPANLGRHARDDSARAGLFASACPVASVSSLPPTGCNPHARSSCVARDLLRRLQRQLSLHGDGDRLLELRRQPTPTIASATAIPTSTGKIQSCVMRVALQAPGEHTGQGATCCLSARRNAPAGTPRERVESVRCVLSNSGQVPCVQMNRQSPSWQGECAAARCSRKNPLQKIAVATDMPMPQGLSGRSRQPSFGATPPESPNARRLIGFRRRALATLAQKASSQSAESLIANDRRAA